MPTPIALRAMPLPGNPCSAQRLRAVAGGVTAGKHRHGCDTAATQPHKPETPAMLWVY